MTQEMVDFLSKLVSMQSVSSDPDKRDEARNTADHIKTQLESLGAQVNIVENEKEGLNPLLMGKLGDDPDKKRILFYSHYDVQPAHIDDGWELEPFTLVEKDDGYVYGRGTNDDKGPITATYFAIKELVEKGDPPVNVAWLYEGEEESASGGFVETVERHKDYFGKVDGVLVLDTSWFNDDRPSMDYGFRGIAYMEVEIEGPKKDQHSGYGGSLREPLIDLVHLMSKLVTPDSKVQIPGFYDDVLPVTQEEKELYENVELSNEFMIDYFGRDILLTHDTKKMLMNLWRNPTLSIHGVEGAFSGPGGKTVIPAKVKGKVSMRLVPDQNPEKIAELFTEYTKSEFEKLNSPNKLEIRALGTGDWWYGDVNNFLFKAGKEAIIDYWGMEPAYARSGGSIPIVPFMEKVFDAPAMGFGVGQTSDGAHSQNERLRIKNLVGAKSVIAKTLEIIGNST